MRRQPRYDSGGYHRQRAAADDRIAREERIDQHHDWQEKVDLPDEFRQLGQLVARQPHHASLFRREIDHEVDGDEVEDRCAHASEILRPNGIVGASGSAKRRQTMPRLAIIPETCRSRRV